MIEFWNERYRQAEYAYGTEPNAFFRQQLDKLPPGHLLLPAEGEGRNAVYAALQGWNVSAFDQSAEGKKKADRLAEQKGVTIDYVVSGINNVPFPPGRFDAAGLIYAHFPRGERQRLHRAVAACLRPGGTVILEAFSKRNLECVRADERIGGPRDETLLYTTADIQSDFDGFDILHLAEEDVELHEGLYHNGSGRVIRFVGRKE
jgi:SAM-dependent methyltransferase